MKKKPTVMVAPNGDYLLAADGLIRFLVELDEMPPNKHKRAQIEQIQRIARAAITTAELISSGPVDVQDVLERVFDVAHIERAFMPKGDIDGLLTFMASRGAKA